MVWNWLFWEGGGGRGEELFVWCWGWIWMVVGGIGEVFLRKEE